MNIADMLLNPGAVGGGQDVQKSNNNTGSEEISDSFLRILTDKLSGGDQFSLSLDNMMTDISASSSMENQNQSGADDFGQFASEELNFSSADDRQVEFEKTFSAEDMGNTISYLEEENASVSSEDFEKLGFNTETANKLEELAEDFDSADEKDIEKLQQILEEAKETEGDDEESSEDVKKMLEMLETLAEKLEKVEELLEEGKPEEASELVEELTNGFKELKKELDRLDNQVTDFLVEKISAELEKADVEFNSAEIEELFQESPEDGLSKKISELAERLEELEKLLSEESSEAQKDVSGKIDELQQIGEEISELFEKGEGESSGEAESGDVDQMVKHLIQDKFELLNEEAKSEDNPLVEKIKEIVSENPAVDTDESRVSENNKPAETKKEEDTSETKKQGASEAQKNDTSEAEKEESVKEEEDSTAAEEKVAASKNENSPAKSEESKDDKNSAVDVEKNASETGEDKAKTSEKITARGSEEQKNENNQAVSADASSAEENISDSGKININRFFSSDKINISEIQNSQGINSGVTEKVAEKVAASDSVETKTVPEKPQEANVLRQQSQSKMLSYELNAAAPASGASNNSGEGFTGHGQQFGGQSDGKLMQNEQTQASYLNRERMLEAQQLIDQLAEKSKMMLDEGKQTMRIKLKPEVLGEVKLEVSMENNRLTANFHVEQGKTKEILDTEVRHLRHSLEQMGLDIEGINIQDLNTETGPGDTDTWFDEEKQTFARQDGSDPESPEEVEAAAQPRRQSLREYSTMELVA